MDLVSLDHISNGGSGVLTTQPGHVEVERYRSATKWATGQPRQYRVGCSIGPHRYSDLGAWDAAGPRELDAWPAIDLRAGLSAREGVRAAVSRCGYACDWGDDYGLTVRRGGVAVHLLPVALAWVNDRGQQQIIATPTPGRPVAVDDAGLWALDAFGPGIDYGARLWPDMLRPVIRVNNPAALFVGLNRPTIDPTGLRLAKVLNVGYDGGQPDRDMLFRQSRFRRQARATHLTGRADETRRDPGKVPIHHTRGAALWFGEARAWDDEQGWTLRQMWSRYGDDVTLSLSLAAEDVAAAVGPLCIDTTMSEEQVGASADDARDFGTTWPGTGSGWSATNTDTRFGLSGSYYYMAVHRFTPPLHQSSSISEASISVKSYSALSGAIDATIIAEDSGDASTFAIGSHVPNDVYANRTSASAAWSIASAWSANTWYGATGETDANDISAVLQEIVDRVDWASGNGLCMAEYKAESGGSAYYRRLLMYDSNSADAAKLNATYTEAAAGGQPYAARIAHIPHMGIRGFRPGRGR